jgi:hypothetical protein
MQPPSWPLDRFEVVANLSFRDLAGNLREYHNSIECLLHTAEHSGHYEGVFECTDPYYTSNFALDKHYGIRVEIAVPLCVKSDYGYLLASANCSPKDVAHQIDIANNDTHCGILPVFELNTFTHVASYGRAKDAATISIVLDTIASNGDFVYCVHSVNLWMYEADAEYIVARIDKRLAQELT